MSPVRSATVLYDPQCALCRRARQWLSAQSQLCRLELLAAGSEEAYLRFPGLDHASTTESLTVVADDGRVWQGDDAFLVCLWATREHRPAAVRLATPALRPMARRIFGLISDNRELLGNGC